MKCPGCENELNDGYLYLRGLGTFLSWSTGGSTRFFSRKGLEPIDLGKLSTTPTGGQAVLPAARCEQCRMVVFRSA